MNVASIEGGKLAVVAVGSRPSSKASLAPGTPAEDVTPVWTPDSSEVLFVRADKDGTPSVWRYIVSAGTSMRVGPGSGMALSPDGATTVTLPTEATDSDVLGVWRNDGRAYTVAVPSGEPVAVALGNDRIYVSTMSAAGNASLWSLSLDGKQHKQLAGATSAGSTSATYGQLLLSPDGSQLLYTVEGDDGYSRIRVVPTAGGSSVAISGRRDGYPIVWTADGKHILFIEGNAYQGQTTALWRSDLTGHQRKELVKEATL
jgi:Tol biopolymer transport system component